MAATKKQLRDRWQSGPGRAFLEKAESMFGEIGHGQEMAPLLPLLEGLPFRDEVPGGGDLRGMPGCFWREVSVAGFDFSYSSGIQLIDCDASGARFDEAEFHGLLGKKLTDASFKKARLKSCSLDGIEARNARFDEAKVLGCTLEDADLQGASFRSAACKGSVFLRANLVGCDFRGANLEEAVWLAVRLDKTTDLRGARLVNIYNEDHFDNQGNLVNRGTDWRLATHDETTQAGTDTVAQAIEHIDAALELLAEQSDPAAKDLAARLAALKTKLPSQPNELWLDHLFDELPPDRRDWAQTIFNQAMRNLL
jgi:uncharacterized protein YjbI with pentapeptide repeats